MDDLLKKLPKQVRIGWLTYKITLMNEESQALSQAFGFICHSKQQIRIAENQAPQQMANTLLHEILHGVHFIHGVSNADDEETFTTLGANGLCQVWQDNPEVFEWIDEALHMTEVTDDDADK